MLPLKLLRLELLRQGILNNWYSYLKLKSKLVKTFTRIEFLKTCHENKLIPKLLKFRIPTIDCFNKYAVEMFQTKLLKTELRNANNLLDKKKKETEECLIQLRPKIPAKLIPTVLLHTRIAWSTERENFKQNTRIS